MSGMISQSCVAMAGLVRCYDTAAVGDRAIMPYSCPKTSLDDAGPHAVSVSPCTVGSGLLLCKGDTSASFQPSSLRDSATPRSSDNHSGLGPERSLGFASVIPLS